MFSLALILVLTGPVSQAADVVTVSTPQGDITGTLGPPPGLLSLAPALIKFSGVPFAQPPIGNLRFKAPQPPSNWTGVRDGSKQGKMCMQGARGRVKPSQTSEDCLYLDLYVPAVNTGGSLRAPSPSDKVPVMVWIHGGGYIYGTGIFYDGSVLAQKGVIVVSINYRLDMFGFLSTQDDVLPGNYGMLDQIMALKWVKNNIVSFGGDPDSVTIFGESAGSSSVSLLILSPLAKGLFHRAIMESGAATSPWGFAHPGNKVSPRVNARLVAAAVSCTDMDDTVKLLGCLQAVDASALINASLAVSYSLDNNYVIGPRVETTFGFLPELPESLLSKGLFNHVDTIQGYNSEETALWVFGLERILTLNKTAVEKADLIAQFWLKQLNKRDQVKMLQHIRQNYLTNQSNETELYINAVRSQDDIALRGPIRLQLNSFISKASEKQHFLYEYNYRPSWGSPYPTWVSSVHGQELISVFGPKMYKVFGTIKDGDYKAIDQKVLRQMSEMWTDFAKYGAPVGKTAVGPYTWGQYQWGRFICLEINAYPREKILGNTQDTMIDAAIKFLTMLDGIGK